MSSLLRIILLLLLAVTFTVDSVVAQTDEVYDYKKYKFYAEEEDATEPWWLLSADTLTQRLSTLDAPRTLTTDLRFSLSAVERGRRGEGYDEERYLANNLPINYKTARLLSSIGVRRTLNDGLLAAPHSGALTATTTYHLAEDATYSYKRHYLRGELSGRNYLGGISYSATFIPSGKRPTLKEDWHIRLFTRARTGRDIYVEGVHTNSLDIATSLSRHRRASDIGIVLLLPFSERGIRSASVEEAYTLTGNTMYNPSWGMQSGKVRNSRIATTLRPELLLSWKRRITTATTVVVAANSGYEYGGYTTLAWFDAMSTAPDNYRYLPSFQMGDDERRVVTNAWRNNDLRYTQIDWEGIYHTNSLQSSGEAAYIVENRRNNTLYGNATAGIRGEYAHLSLDCGIDLNYTTTRSFKLIDDLLGADHIIDLDYYLLDDATYSNHLQNDLRNPNRKVVEGGRFGYDYRLTRRSVALRGLIEWQCSNHLCLMAGIRIAAEQSLRSGYYEKELFAGSNSYGKSRTINLTPYRINIALLYTLGKHRLQGSVMLRGESPDIDNLFLQPQYNNHTVDNPSLRHSIAGELNYAYTTPTVELNATAFITSTTNDTEVVRYYDDLAATYSDAVIANIARLNFGIELSSKIRYSRLFTSTFALTLAQYRFSQDAQLSLYADTDNDLIATSNIALGNCHAPYPEITAYGDIAFRSPSGWSARLSAQYWGLRRVEPSLIRRSERITSYATSPEELSAISEQQRLADAITLDLSVGKRFRFRGGSSLFVQLAVRNLLGSDIVARGYEQHRIRRQTIQQRTHIEPFADRLTYAYPRTAYLSLGFLF